MTPTRLDCPKCRRNVPEVYWHGMDLVRCPACECEFEPIRFPALGAVRPVDLATVLTTGEANCFFHAQNRAEVACEGCGRYLCSVCRVNFAGRILCPSCLAARDDRRKLPENHRILYERIAVLIAFLPLFVWPFTLVTAPAAIGFCLYAWKKPGSLLPRRRRLALIVAGTVASLEVIGWLIIFGRMLLA